MKEYLQKQRLLLGKMFKNNVENDDILSYRVLYFLPSETLISTNTVFSYSKAAVLFLLIYCLFILLMFVSSFFRCTVLLILQLSWQGGESCVLYFILFS